MKLVITKVLDKPRFVQAIRGIYYTLSLQERINLADHLPFQDEDMYMLEEELNQKLSKCAEYTYGLAANEDCCAPPWERQDYIDAKVWYGTLSKEDQIKIDVLVRANVPWA